MQYRNLGRLHQPEELEIRLINCGYYKDVDRSLHTRRPAGSRMDHHLILVRRGEFRVLIQDQEHTVREGGLVYIPPGAEQDYLYTPGAGTAYYWLHFDGPLADRLVAQMPLEWGAYQPSPFSELIRLLDQLLSHPAYRQEDYFTGLNGYLLVFLSTLSRCLGSPGGMEGKLMEIVQELQIHPETALTNGEYARRCDISEYHFTRLFRLQTGVTPHRFRNRALMEKARQLLLDTDMNISEVARTLGIQDPLYFSRLFRQHFGESPSQYRNRK